MLLWTNAVFMQKQDRFEFEKCVIGKVIRLSDTEYSRFTRNMLRDQDFIRDNRELMGFKDGMRHCLLVIGEGYRDGILIDSSGYDYARYSAFISNAEHFLSVEHEALDELNQRLADKEISDPSVTQTDMYAYGYSFEGMIPLGKERALELFDKGSKVLLLYQDDTDEWAGSRREIELFHGMLGIEKISRDGQPEPKSFEVFVVNHECFKKGEIIGEWLTLPSSANTLRGLFERIGFDKSDAAVYITAIRLPYDCMRDYITKRNNLDELNMLATYMKNMKNDEIEKLQAILTSEIMMIGKEARALINLLAPYNFDRFKMIKASNNEELGRHYEGEKPVDISIEEYGKQIAAKEKGAFTEWGYIYNRDGNVCTEYTGTVPDKYKIIGEAFCSLPYKIPVRDEIEKTEEKSSVLDQIKAGRQVPQMLRDKDTHRKNKGGPEL